MNMNDSFHIVIDSMPSSWVDTLSALMTPLIAGIALYIAYQQKQINKQRLRHETYERRLQVYKSVQKHLSIIFRNGKATTEECIEFYSSASEAAFLFDKSVMEKIEEIYKKSLELGEEYEKLYPLDGSQGLPVGEERSEVSKKKGDLLKWHSDQLAVCRDFFSEKLGLKNT